MKKKQFVDDIKTKRILKIEKLVETKSILTNQEHYYKLKEEEFKIKQIELEKNELKKNMKCIFIMTNFHYKI